MSCFYDRLKKSAGTVSRTGQILYEGCLVKGSVLFSSSGFHCLAAVALEQEGQSGEGQGDDDHNSDDTTVAEVFLQHTCDPHIRAEAKEGGSHFTTANALESGSSSTVRSDLGQEDGDDQAGNDTSDQTADDITTARGDDVDPEEEQGRQVGQRHHAGARNDECEQDHQRDHQGRSGQNGGVTDSDRAVNARLYARLPVSPYQNLSYRAL